MPRFFVRLVMVHHGGGCLTGTVIDSANPELASAAFLAAMPKAELHVHLEGTLDPAQRSRFAARNGMAVADDAPAAYTDLTGFLAAYYPAMDVLQTEQDFYDLAYAYLATAAGQQVRHAEMFFDPQAHTSRGIPFSSVVTGYHRAVVDAERDLDIGGHLIMCILRDHSVESAAQTLEASLQFKNWIVGIGLDSDERGNPPAKFALVFARARDEGYLLTMHCDVDQADSVEHIRQAVEDIRVDRLDHGTNIVDDPRLVALVVERGIGLTSCPLSNAVVSSGDKSAEIAQLLRAGAKISVNSDDPAYFGGYVTENLVALAGSGLFSRDDFVRLQRNAFETAWIPSVERDAHLAALEEFVAGWRG
jgi:adenosine deaminase